MSFWNNLAADTKETRKVIEKSRSIIEDKNSSLDEVARAANELIDNTVRNQPCALPWYTSWQKIFKQAEAKYDICLSLHSNLASSKAFLKNLSDFIDRQQQLAKVISTNIPSGTLKEEDWSKQLELLRGAKESLEKQKGKQSQSLKDTLAVFSGYESSLSSLIKANSDKDMAAFEKAADKLTASFKKLQALPAAESKEYQQLRRAVLSKLNNIS